VRPRATSLATVRIDLHTHSNVSDGTDSPAEVMRHAAAAGVDVVALTDHDTTDGWSAAVGALAPGLTLISGAEISCSIASTGGRDVELHLLAYLFDPSEPLFAAERYALTTDRERRARAMVEKLVALGVPVTYAQVAAIAGDASSVGRPHIARALVDAGVVPDVASAFTAEWIGSNGRAYAEKYTLDAAAAVRLVLAAGGVPVFAHPAAAKRGPVVTDADIAGLAAAGLAGLEVDHPDHSPQDRARLRALAGELGLFVTGSSDDHGDITGHRIGCETTSEVVYEELLARATGIAPVSG
jgi:predicted metal-dependent phosphoesterase TrpH